LVEHRSCKADVVGSIPTPGSELIPTKDTLFHFEITGGLVIGIEEQYRPYRPERRRSHALRNSQ
jgi:hypothetical protein